MARVSPAVISTKEVKDARDAVWGHVDPSRVPKRKKPENMFFTQRGSYRPSPFHRSFRFVSGCATGSSINDVLVLCRSTATLCTSPCHPTSTSFARSERRESALRRWMEELGGVKQVWEVEKPGGEYLSRCPSRYRPGWVLLSTLWTNQSCFMFVINQLRCFDP